MKKTINKIFFYGLIILMLIILNNKHLKVDGITYDKKVLLIIINRLSLEDISKMENTLKFIHEGSLALMNTRGYNGYDNSDSYVTINASRRSIGSLNLSKYYSISELGQDVNKGLIYNLYFNNLIKLNINNGYSPYLGALGDNLHRGGHKTAVFGNSDTADSIIRTNCYIATDSNGMIDYGNVDDILIKDSKYIFNYKTDYEKIFMESQYILKKASLIVIETGDLNRLYPYKDKISREEYIKNRDNILKEIDIFLGRLHNEMDRRSTRLIILSPNMSDEIIENSKLSPLIIWGNGIEKGILQSPTTRKMGIVTNLDVAPTITSYLDSPSNYFLGNEITFKRVDNNYSKITRLNDKINLTSKIRPIVMKIFSSLIFVIITVYLILLILLKYFKISFKVPTLPLHILLVLPSTLLIVSMFNYKGVYDFIFYCIIILSFTILSLTKVTDNKKIFIISELTIILIIGDIFVGGRLMRYSILSYDPIIGARFFGIGNELLGILLGNLSIFLGMYTKMYKKYLYIILLLLTIVIIIFHGKLGANIGGTISIGFMTLVFIIALLYKDINIRKLTILVLTCTLLLLSIGIIDIFLSNTPSHFGNTIINYYKLGPNYVKDILLRKVTMNIKLIGISVWGKVLVFTMLSMGILFLANGDKIVPYTIKNKTVGLGLFSGLVGSLVGFLFNDSGVLLSAFANVFITVLLIYTTLSFEGKRQL